MQSNTPYTAEEFKVTSWEHYCKLAARTESIPECEFHLSPNPNEIITRLLHASLGIANELTEFYEALKVGNTKNMLEELGDSFWYLAIMENTVVLPDLSEMDALSFPENSVWFWVGEVQDVVKRAIFYGEDLFTTNKKGIIPIERFGLAFHGINYCLQELNREHLHKSQSYYFTSNIEKLAKRYPDLIFKETDALDRDVENELSHIEDTEDAAIVRERQGEPTISVTIEQIIEESMLDAEPGYETRTKSEAMLHAHSELSTEVPNCSALFADYAIHMLDVNEFNHRLREHLTTNQVEQLAMTLAFNTAATYRAMGANGIARAYDDLYKQYSGRGDKLDDSSCFIMWQFLGYALTWEDITEKLVELKVYG